MRSISISIAWLLLALLFAIHPAGAAEENEVWWASAQAEAEDDGYRLMDVRTFRESVEAGVLVIDVRADYEYAAGHIPGAQNLEFDLGDRTDLPDDKKRAFESLAGPDKKRTLVIYCRSFR